MSKHAKSKNNFRNSNNGSRPPRWSNGTLLSGTPAYGHHSRPARSHNHNRPSVPTRARAPEPQPAVGKLISQQLSHGRRHRVLVLTKSEAAKGAISTYSSRFERSKNPGKGSEFVAVARIHGRPVFLDRNSRKPTDNRVYGFELVGENPSCSVYFAQIVVPEDFAKPTSFSIDVATGKIVANNARRPKVKPFKSKKPFNGGEFKGAFVHDVNEDSDDLFGSRAWDFADDYGYDSRFTCTGDCEEDECECGPAEGDDAYSVFHAEIAEKQAMRPLNATWCHSCGCRICECDGTPQVDGQPYLMPAHLKDVRFSKRVSAPRAPRQPRQRDYWSRW